MWWSTSKSGCYVSKASNVGSFLGARGCTYAGRAEQSLVWSSGCNIVSEEEEALITASFAWLHLSYPSILLTVQKFTQIIVINTNLLVLISLDRVLRETETLLLLHLDNAVFAQRLRYTRETLNCTWIIYLALADFPPAVSGKLRTSKRWKMAKWRSLETEASWMGSSSPGDHWSPRGDLNIRRSKELQLRLHI